MWEGIMQKLMLTSALALVMGGSAWAAPLTGSQLDFQYRVGTLAGAPYALSDNGPITVGAGVEVGNVADNAAWLDISDDRIVVRFLYGNFFGASDAGGPLQFNGWVLSDVLGAVDAFTAVSIDTAATTLADLGAVNLSFNADAITVDWKGLNFQMGEQLVLKVETGVIPEPGSLPLILAGLLGIAAVRIRS